MILFHIYNTINRTCVSRVHWGDFLIMLCFTAQVGVRVPLVYQIYVYIRVMYDFFYNNIFSHGIQRKRSGVVAERKNLALSTSCYTHEPHANIRRRPTLPLRNGGNGPLNRLMAPRMLASTLARPGNGANPKQTFQCVHSLAACHVWRGGT